MKVAIKDTHLTLTDIQGRVYIDDNLWVSTSCGLPKVGVTNGPVYKVFNGRLIEILKNGDGRVKCSQ